MAFGIEPGSAQTLAGVLYELQVLRAELAARPALGAPDVRAEVAAALWENQPQMSPNLLAAAVARLDRVDSRLGAIEDALVAQAGPGEGEPRTPTPEELSVLGSAVRVRMADAARAVLARTGREPSEQAVEILEQAAQRAIDQALRDIGAETLPAMAPPDRFGREAARVEQLERLSSAVERVEARLGQVGQVGQVSPVGPLGPGGQPLQPQAPAQSRTNEEVLARFGRLEQTLAALAAAVTARPPTPAPPQPGQPVPVGPGDIARIEQGLTSLGATLAADRERLEQAIASLAAPSLPSADGEPAAAAALGEISQQLARVEATASLVLDAIRASGVARDVERDGLAQDVARVEATLRDQLEAVADLLAETVTTRADGGDVGLAAVSERVDAQLAEVAKQVDTGLAKVTEALPQGLTAVSERVDAQLAEVAKQVDTGLAKVTEALPRGLTARLDRLESALGRVSQVVQKTMMSRIDGLDAGVAGLAESLGQLESTLAGLSPGDALRDDVLGALAGAAREVRADVADLSGKVGDESADLRLRLEAARDKLDTLERQTDTSVVAQQVRGEAELLTQRVAALSVQLHDIAERIVHTEEVAEELRLAEQQRVGARAGALGRTLVNEVKKAASRPSGAARPMPPAIGPSRDDYRRP